MKKYLFSLIFLSLSYVGFAQKGLSYQAVILDPNPIEAPGVDINGQPFVNGDVWVKFSIYANSSMQFEEVHKTKTDAYGLVNLMIGSVSAASFNSLVWDNAQKTLQVHVSFDQGGTYTKVSDQKLTYNPYSLYAETASKLGGTLDITGGGTGATTLADARVNLGVDKVDNTPDAAKPISAAVQAALDLKANKGDIPAATATITDADATTKGKIQLAGDLAGTAAAPTVPGLALKANTADVTTALALKANASDVTTALAAKADTAYVLTKVAAATIVDADANTKGKIQLTGDLGGTAAAPTVPGLALKANASEVTTALALKANTSDLNTALAIKADTAYVLTKVAAATIVDADANTKGKIQLAGDLGGTAAAPTVPGLALKANASEVTTALATKANTADMTSALALKANNSDVTTALAAKADNSFVISQIASATIADADANTKGKIQLTGDLGGTAAAPTVPGLALKANATDLVSLTSDVNTNTASITANASSIAGETTRATAAELVLTNSVTANTASITANIAAIDLKAPIASPTFTGTLTAPIYATTPQLLTSGSTITWNPTQGLNASVTLDQNSTLSFSATPPSGSYGTLVVTQDGTGGRTLSLPSTTNKVLGSTSSTSIALSTAAGAKDIINFYYDGTNCYWNVGQGYGTASTTDLASNVSGTLAVANGGTGATTLTGLVKGTGTSALTAAVAGTDYLAPNGSAANLTNFPTLNQNTTGNAATVTTNANLTGDVTSVGNTSTVVKINGTSLASLSTGILKNTTSTGVPTIAVAGTDYQAPLTLTTTGTGAATFSGTSLNIPTPSDYSLPTATGSILGGIKVGSNLSIDGNGVLSANINSGTISTTSINTGAITATSINTPIYASTPQTLTDAATISWNPANGLNANVTLGGNRTLSFTTTPASGSYGTLVVTQDGTGGRTLTLPSGTHKVLGSATSTISLSATAGAKDILNFYYDGLTSTYYWNVGQGYGAASTFTANNIAGGAAGSIPYQTASGATSLLAKGSDGYILTLVSGTPSWAAAPATGVTSVAMTTPTGLSVSGSPITSSGTLALSLTSGYAIPLTSTQTNWDAAYTNRITSASSPLSISSNALSLGTVPVSSGGTGATTLTGIIKGTGTSALTAAVAGTDYQAPLTLTTTGTGAATLSGTTLNIPTGVPYSGATGAVDLGAYDLTVHGLTVGRGKEGVASNTAIGLASLAANTTGANNTATGYASLAANTTGGNNNTATGYGTLSSNTSGFSNTAVGSLSLVKNTNGTDNTAMGFNSLAENIAGIKNTGVGTYSLWKNTASNNTAFGYGALALNVSGTSNVAQGVNALSNNTSGSDNTAIGMFSMLINTTGSFNTALGSLAEVNANNLSNSTAIGYGARVLASNTIQLGADGSNIGTVGAPNITTAITNVRTSGTLTLKDVTYPNSHNNSNGQVLTVNGSGVASWATPAASGVPYSGATGAVDLGAFDLTVKGITIGKGATGATATNDESTAMGAGALLNASNTGANNTAFGHRTLYSNTTGANNTVVGGGASYSNAGGSNNVAIGSAALFNSVSGTANVAIGKSAGQYMTGSKNTAIGAYSDMNAITYTNATAIGHSARVMGSNRIQLGADGSTVNGEVTTAIENVRTSGTLTLGAITYPNTNGSTNQVLTATAGGTLTWTTPSTTATAYSGTLGIGNGGTNSTATPTNGGVVYGTGTALGYSAAGTSGQVLISAGTASPTWATLTAGSAITISNSGGIITIAAAVRPMTDQTIATSSHAVATATFTLSQTPLNTKVWMFINGVRTNNLAYTVSGTTVTYTAANNNSYTIVVGDRIQFDYAY